MDPDTASQLIGTLVTALGLLFVLAGVSKLLRPAAFRRPLEALTSLPTALLPVAGLLVVAMEIIGGAGLMLGRHAGAVVTLLLLGATTALAFRALVRRQEVPCACFGSSATRVSRATIVRNLGFAVIAALPLLAPATTATTPVIVSGVTVLMLYMWFEAVVGGAIRRVRRASLVERRPGHAVHSGRSAPRWSSNGDLSQPDDVAVGVDVDVALDSTRRVQRNSAASIESAIRL